MSDTVHFEVGDRLTPDQLSEVLGFDPRDYVSAGSLRTGMATVTAVNREAGTITLTAEEGDAHA